MELYFQFGVIRPHYGGYFKGIRYIFLIFTYMNKLHHFGDSYATIPQGTKHFVELLSDNLNLTYMSYGVGGSSNELILTEFLKRIYKFKEGDVIFFNFSYFVRGTYYDKDKKKILSSNLFVNDTRRNYREKDLENLEYVMSVFDYHVNNLEDYNRKVFDKFDTIFELLVKRNIKICYLFIENSEFSDDLLKHGTNIKIENGFCKWLYEMDYHKDEDCHYTRGVQGNILEYIMNLYPHIPKEKRLV